MAEKLFFQLLRSQTPFHLQEKIHWVAQEGLTPGYDIRDDRDTAQITAYEVKGTTGSGFRSVDITANEMKCALEMGPKYALVLVTGIGKPAPQYQVIRNLAKHLSLKQAVATPSAFWLTFNSDVQIS